MSATLLRTVPPRTVAVTGATGFVGGPAVGALIAAGWQVRALTRRPRDGRSGLLWVPGDLDNADSLAELMRGADACLHIAGAIKGRDRNAFASANIDGTRRVVTTARAAGVRRLVHVSSLAAREPDLSDYSWSKAEAEALVAAEAQGLDWTVLRPPAVYGPGDKETLSLFRSTARGLAPLPGGPTRTSLIHVDDLAAALVACLESPALPGVTLEVHDGRPAGYALAELYALIGAALGKRALPVTVPRAALRLAGRANAWAAPLFGVVPMVTPGKVRELLHPDWTSSDDRLTTATGWQPAIDAPTGLAATAAWYKAHGWL